MDFNNMNYDNFNEEMLNYINKVMDIYSIIKDKKIVKNVRDVLENINYEFTKLDKKVLALFIASFLVDGNLKDILDEYDDLKLNDLFDFIDIQPSDIIPLTNEEYKTFYDKNIKLDLVRIIKERNWLKEIHYLTPEVIVASLQFMTLSGSNILDYYKEKYDIHCGGLGLSEHPVFNALTNYSLMAGSISDKELPKRNNNDFGMSLFSPPRFSNNFSEKKQNDPLIPIDNGKLDSKFLEEEQVQEEKIIDSKDDKIWDLLDEIKQKFIGQEETVEGLFYNIVNNQQLANMEDVPDGQRSIIFLDGPTGTGKTAITREITEKLGLPFVATSTVNYSSTGYAGGNLTDLLKQLYDKANGDLEKAQRGIIVLDEFDKIAYSRSGGLEMKKAVQQQLLDFMGGGKYTITTGNSIFFSSQAEFDTSKLTFVCLGALTDLRAKKTSSKQAIGFGGSSVSEQVEYNITPQDLTDIGLERELVGRLNTYLHTNEYDEYLLKRILKESTISPIIGFTKWAETMGKTVQIDEEVYNLIASQAYVLNTGARSLQTVMNNIRTQFIREVLRGKEKVIQLNALTVAKINDQMMNRRVRG